jgi:hypothetical protein
MGRVQADALGLLRSDAAAPTSASEFLKIVVALLAAPQDSNRHFGFPEADLSLLYLPFHHAAGANDPKGTLARSGMAPHGL